MGVSHSIPELLGKVSQLPQMADRIAKQAVVKNAQLAKRNALDEAGRIASGGLLKNVGRKGSRLTAGYDIAQDGLSAKVKARGAWGLVEFPTRKVPYAITSRKARGSRRTRGAAVLAGTFKTGSFKAKTGVGPLGGTVVTGGRGGHAAISTPFGLRAYAIVRKARKAKHPWENAYKRTAREAPSTLLKIAQEEGRKVFG